MPFVLDGSEGRVEIVARGVRHEITFERRPHPPGAAIIATSRTDGRTNRDLVQRAAGPIQQGQC